MRTRLLSSLLLLGLSASAGAQEMVEVPNRQPLPPPLIAQRPPIDPHDYRVEPNMPALIAGVVAFATIYFSNSLAGALLSEGALAIPVAGPIIDALEGSGRADLINACLVMDALAQAGALGIAIAGAASHHRVLKRGVTVAPSLLPGGAGASMSLRF